MSKAKTNKQAVQDFDQFAGIENTSGVEVETRKWNFSQIGYKSGEAILYVGDKQLTAKDGAIDMTLFAIRQSKSVKVGKQVNRYNLYQDQKNMVAGKITYHVQTIVMVDGELYVFGSNRFTTSMFFTNPATGSNHRKQFMVGLYPALQKLSVDVRKSHNVVIAPFDVSFRVKVGTETMEVGSEETNEVTPLLHSNNFTINSPEDRAKYAELYEREELAEWINVWKNIPIVGQNAPAPVAEKVEESVGEDFFESFQPHIENDDPAF